jgi:hypothetical protein
MDWACKRRNRQKSNRNHAANLARNRPQPSETAMKPHCNHAGPDAQPFPSVPTGTEMVALVCAGCSAAF